MNSSTEDRNLQKPWWVIDKIHRLGITHVRPKVSHWSSYLWNNNTGNPGLLQDSAVCLRPAQPLCTLPMNKAHCCPLSPICGISNLSFSDLQYLICFFNITWKCSFLILLPPGFTDFLGQPPPFTPTLEKKQHLHTPESRSSTRWKGMVQMNTLGEDGYKNSFIALLIIRFLEAPVY